MATPCANCVYRGTSWCGIFCGRSNLGRDVEKAPGDKRIRSVFVGGGESGLEDLRWNPRLFPLVAALLLFFVASSWAACVSTSYSYRYYGGLTCSTGGCNGKPSSCNAATMMSQKFTAVFSGTYYADCSPSQCKTGSYYESCGSAGCTATGSVVPTHGTCYLRCDSQADLDSLKCVYNPDDLSCRCDSLYTCQSVFTENNVLRSEITLTDCHGTVLSQRYVIGSCGENGFCQGSEVAGSDSCTYDSVDPSKCRSGGQNGSLCTYVCPDGQLHTCRIAWNAGTPAEYQPCPSVPPTDCVTPRSSSSVSSSPSVDDLPDNPGGTSYGSSSSGSGYDPESPCPECDILIAIRDTLHRANDQRRYQNYLLDTMKANIGGFGAQFDKIIGNTREQVTQGNAIKNSLSSIASSNLDISDKLNDLDLDDITATVDSVVVHVDVTDSSSPPPWLFFDLDSLPVWRDTVSDIHRAVDDVVKELDSLNKDTTGVIGKYLPFLKKMSDKLDDLTGDCDGFTCLYRPVIDTLMLRMKGEFGLDTMTAEDDSTYGRRIQLNDSVYVEGNWICEEHPDWEACAELDSADIPEIAPPDTDDVRKFFEWQDSLLAHIDSVTKDTTADTVGLDDLAGDSLVIRQKLAPLFFQGGTVEQCFEFRMRTGVRGHVIDILIDFADMYGLDLCDLIRKIVRMITFILIVVTTVKGYIKAFGGGGPGGG